MAAEFVQQFHTGIYNYYAAYIAVFGTDVHDKLDYHTVFNVDGLHTRESDIICTIRNSYSWTYSADMSLEDFFEQYRKAFWYEHVPNKACEKLMHYDEKTMYTSYTDEELNEEEQNLDIFNVKVTKIEALAFLYQLTRWGKNEFIRRYGMKYEPVWNKVVGRPYNPIEIGAMKELKATADAIADTFQDELHDEKVKIDVQIKALDQELAEFQKKIEEKKNVLTCRLADKLADVKGYYKGKIEDVVAKMKAVTGEPEIPLNSWMRG